MFEGKSIDFIYLLSIIKKVGKLCVYVSNEATMQGHAYALQNCRNQWYWKLMITRSCCVEIRLWDGFVGFLQRSQIRT